jgi:hypothetical protein
MKTTKQPIVSKLLPSTMQRRRLPIEDEIREAKASLAYWWFKTLQCNDAYAACCLAGGEGEMAALYADFGDVHMPFSSWWLKHGRQIFRESAPLKRVSRIAADYELRKLCFGDDKLILEIDGTAQDADCGISLHQAGKAPD